MPDTDETPVEPTEFDFSAFPGDTLFLDRRTLGERRGKGRETGTVRSETDKPAPERRARKERRRRIDPTTFEKQYTDDEIEFMNAVQHFKTQSGKSFPSHGDILRIAARLGYRKSYDLDDTQEPTALETTVGSMETSSATREAILPFLPA